MSSRQLMAYYIVALTIIAVLSIASHVILEQVLRSNEGSAAIINVSGRQRMLSQRIASLAAQYRLGDSGVRGDLIAALGRFETQHDRLIEATNARRAGAGTSALQAMYFEGKQPLDGEVRQFVADGRAVAALGPGDPAMARPLADLFALARAPMLDGLDAVVSIHQRESEATLAELERIQWAILIVVLVTLAAEALAIFRPMVNRIVAFTQEIMRLASTDPLTGVANRRHFMERAAAEVERARRSGQALSLLMVDADHFKKVNDTYGHDVGDAVLTALAEALVRNVRPMDVVARLGGEEFAVLLPEASVAMAAESGERLRAAVAALRVPHGDVGVAFTVSIGAAPVAAAIHGVEEALKAADAALYEAKQSGRNRVVVARVAADEMGTAELGAAGLAGLELAQARIA
jgi:diguanylate cyclase (GGDEF)-like protein